MNSKIKATVKTANGTHDIEMPLSQNDFDKALTAAEIFTGSKEEYTIEAITSNMPDIDTSLAHAKDIEELNYLATRLDSFIQNEIDTFSAIVKAQDASMTMSGLINLTFNIWDYNVEQSISDIQELGEKYVEQESPDLDEKIFENLDFEGIGMEVQIEQGGQFTDVGYISNFNQAFEKLYNGQFFPDYDYEGGYLLKMEFKGIKPIARFAGMQQSVFIMLPASENAINRALNRLGVEGIYDCYIPSYYSTKFSINQFLTDYENPTDLKDLNTLACKLETIPEYQIEAFNNALPQQVYVGNIQDLIKFAEHFAVEQSLQHQQQNQLKQKPDCPLIGADGNVFNLMGIASKTLKGIGMTNEAKEMCDKIMQSGSYNDALNIIGDYVTITDHEQEMDNCPKMEM